MEYYKVSMVLLCTAFMAKAALAAQHLVGGSQGWDESTDFGSWASGQKFKVGDQLVFKYATGLHSVVELGSESAYKSCDIGSALDSMNSGSDVVRLDKPGTRYFACGTAGHCGQGMKVKVTTESGTAPSTPDSPSSPTSVKASSASKYNIHSSLILLIAVLVGTVSFHVV